MKSSELLTAVVLFAAAAGLLVLAILHFLERGPLLNNAAIYASREERETMDKKPWYRQSAIVFCLLSAVFVVLGLTIVLGIRQLQLLEIPLFVAVVVYAVVSSVRINRKAGKAKESRG